MTPLGFLTQCARMGMPDARTALKQYRKERTMAKATDAELAAFVRDTVKLSRHVSRPMGPNNEDRALWALDAVNAFQGEVGTEDEDAIADLLCDLMHLCDKRTLYGSFENALLRAISNYQAEKDEENEG